MIIIINHNYKIINITFTYQRLAIFKLVLIVILYNNNKIMFLNKYKNNLINFTQLFIKKN